MMRWFLVLLLAVPAVAVAADSVDVTFRYNVAGFPSGVSVPGEFNGWNNTAAPMIYQGGTLWIRTIRLAVGGQPAGGIPGAYQYKFYYSGVTTWPNDPLNHHVNLADNSNSFLPLGDPTIYHLLPNQRNPIVQTATPTISAYLYPKVGSTVDTSALELQVDTTVYTGIGAAYNVTTKLLQFTVPSPLPNGQHTVILRAGTSADTVTFTTQGGFVQLTNRFPFTTRKTAWPLYGIVGDSTVASCYVVRNGADTFSVALAGKKFSATVPLVEGENVFVAVADSAGILKTSSPVSFIRAVRHAPWGSVQITDLGAAVQLDAGGSTDPDSGALTYLWSDDPENPEPLQGVDGSGAMLLTVQKPSLPGDYYVNLVVSDPQGNKDTSRATFSLHPGGGIVVPGIAGNPSWAAQARIYFMFPKAVSAAGTLNAAAQRLQWVKDLGFNVIWMMPVMVNAFPINNNFGPGYNIVDFYNVAPEYGTNQDFKNFVAQAHALGLKVILDVTPNHSSRYHPWSVDAHTYRRDSPYWGWYQHSYIAHNDNGLGQTFDPDSFYYYGGFSEQLLNLNWTDADLQAEMIRVYTHWIREFAIDGYRFDVYWGPHRRYGEAFMGKPVRDAIKHIRPDVLLLAEDEGTGAGTETIFADYASGGVNGGADAAYDFKLYFNQIRGFSFTSPNIAGLHNEITNGGYYPGEHALYMRFMESQDEDRIVYFYSNGFAVDSVTTFRRTMPMASVVWTAPGVPMLWNGQEIGWGYGIPGAKEARARSVIDWNYEGRLLLAPHYQRLAHIRSQFPAFAQHKRDTNGDGQVTSSDTSDFVLCYNNNGVYGFGRPFPDRNGFTLANFMGSAAAINVNLRTSGALFFTAGVQDSAWYYVNDLMSNTRQLVQGASLASYPVALSPYGSAVLTVSLTPDSVVIENPILDVADDGPQIPPRAYALFQNYPNPFNPSTEIRWQAPRGGWATLAVFDLLGRRVALLVDGTVPPGEHVTRWDAGNLPSGIYFYRLTAPEFTAVKKMMLVR